MYRETYGVTDDADLLGTVEDVVRCLGGGYNAERLLWEIATVETGRGTIEDRTIGAGMGICQFDEIGFDDVKARTRSRHRDSINRCFSVDINDVVWEDLRTSPLLSLIWCRLKFKLIPDAIPSSISGRGSYWKKFYNTSAGKGSLAHYLDMNESLA